LLPLKLVELSTLSNDKISTLSAMGVGKGPQNLKFGQISGFINVSSL